MFSWTTASPRIGSARTRREPRQGNNESRTVRIHECGRFRRPRDHGVDQEPQRNVLRYASKNEIIYGPLGSHCVHLCVDMQRIFAEKTEWHTPWMERIRPLVERIAQHHPAETIFTRFIPAAHPGVGAWRRYYRRWASMTIERIGADMVELVPELARFVAPAETIDKFVYSPWLGDKFHTRLRARREHPYHHWRRDQRLCPCDGAWRR
jgi:hypothetical protein